MKYGNSNEVELEMKITKDGVKIIKVGEKEKRKEPVIMKWEEPKKKWVFEK